MTPLGFPPRGGLPLSPGTSACPRTGLSSVLPPSPFSFLCSQKDPECPVTENKLGPTTRALCGLVAPSRAMGLVPGAPSDLPSPIFLGVP